MTKKIDKSVHPTTVQTRISELSSGRRETMRKVLENPRESCSLACARLWAATSIRNVHSMVQRLAFDGYRAFQNHLDDLLIATYVARWHAEQQPTRSTEVDPLRVTLEQDVKNLNELPNGVEMARFQALAGKIH